MSKKQYIYQILAYFFAGIVIPVAGHIILSISFEIWHGESLPFHVLIETAGGIIAIAISLMLFFIVSNKENNEYSIIASALLIMGSLDIVHSILPPGQSFVWMHSLATFLGGIIIAFVWWKRSVPFIFRWSIACILLMIVVVFFGHEALPMMVNKGEFTFFAKILNITGGIGFYFAAIFFSINYYKNQERNNLIFFNLCILFGTAAVLFELSELWDASWWWWHLLRFIAYSFALIVIINKLIEQQQNIDDSRLRAELLMESAGEGIYGLDLNGNCTFANKVCAKLVGVESTKELIGKNMHELLHHSKEDGSDYPEEECNIYKAFHQGVGVHIDDEVFWKIDGSCYPVEYWSYPIVENETCTGAVVSFIDISKRKKMEARLRQAERMEAVGTLVGGIAHDFNNILASIMGYTELSVMQLAKKKNRKIETYLHEVLKSSELARELVAQMLTFARGADDKRGIYKLSLLIKESMKMLDSVLPSNIEIDLRVNNPNLSVSTSQVLIHQLLINLCTNARDAINGSGKIIIETSYQDNIWKKCYSCHDNIVGGYVQLKITDTGSGIQLEKLKHIFEPYNTSKEMSSTKGSGLGLAVVHGIMHQHNGHIIVETKEKKGTSFCLLFPAIPD